MHKATIAIVATVRDAGPSFKTWIEYHLLHIDAGDAAALDRLGYRT